MSARPDWRHSYAQTEARYQRDIEAARARGQTTYRFGSSGRLLDPTRMTADERAAQVRQAARDTTDRAINQWNEQVAREVARKG